MFLCFRYSTHKTFSEEKKYACHAYLHNSSSTIHKRSYLKLKVLIRHLQERSNMLAKNWLTKPQFRNWWKEILGVDDEIDTRITIIVFHGPPGTGKTYAVKVTQLAYTSAAYTKESGSRCPKRKTARIHTKRRRKRPWGHRITKIAMCAARSNIDNQHLSEGKSYLGTDVFKDFRRLALPR